MRLIAERRLHPGARTVTITRRVGDFTNPSWWPTPPPKAPKPVSTPKLVFGTLIPVVIGIVAVVMLLTNRHHKPDAAVGHTITAFTACIVEQGANEPSERTNARMLNVDAAACRDHLPFGMALPDFTQTEDPEQAAGQDALQQCMQSAYANLSGGGSRRGRPSRKAFQDALSLCRSLTRRRANATPPQ
jgi:hypothetical protein